MKVILGTKPPADPWHPSVINDNAIKEHLIRIFQKSAILINEDFSHTYRDLKIKYPTFATAFLDLLKANSVLILEDKPISPEVSLVSPESILDIEVNPLFISALELHSAHTRKGESREELFARLFGHLIALAKGFVIYDSYALTNLLDDANTFPNSKKGMYWLLTEKLARFPIVLEIHSLPVKHKNNGVPNFDKSVRDNDFQKLRELMGNLEDRHPDFQLHYFHYEPGLGGKHDRFMQLRFASSLMNMYMSKGAEVFDKPSISEAYTISALTVSEMQAKRETWEDPKKPLIL